MNERHATVDELIIILKQLSEEGYGSAEVWCNEEYTLSRPTYEEENPIKSERKGKLYVDFGGYT